MNFEKRVEIRFLNYFGLILKETNNSEHFSILLVEADVLVSVAIEYFTYLTSMGMRIKFMFSKKATKIDEIFTVNVVSVKSRVKISSIFVALLENTNFKKCAVLIFDGVNSVLEMWDKHIHPS